MSQKETVDVLIAGSGPAGMSAALHLAKADPGWADRIAVVEKAVHPREKLCGGGVTNPGEQILSDLGLPFALPHVEVGEMRMICQHRIFSLRDEFDPVFRIVRRDEFDHWLVRCGEEKGIRVRQGEAVTDVIPHDRFVEVHTQKAVFHAGMLVAADGSNSIVRRKLKLSCKLGRARTLEILTPESGRTAALGGGIAEYDFTSIFRGLQGYTWSFPCMVQGKPHMSRGIFDSRFASARPRLHLRNAFHQALREKGLNAENFRVRSFPIQRFDSRGIFALPRILFAGDAAGADPVFGEGISFALAYGDAAAQEIMHAFATGSFTCSDYKKRIRRHPVLRQLPRRTRMARVFYDIFPRIPRTAGYVWDIAPFLFKLFVQCKPRYSLIRQARMTRIR